jgi:hypothetical protein
MPSHELEAHEESRFAHIEACARGRSENNIALSRRGEPERIAEAWGVPLPGSFSELFHRLHGVTLIGDGGVMEIFDTSVNLALQREDSLALSSTPGARVVFFASDGGGCQYFFDVDDYYGHGRYAVLLGDCCSDVCYFVASSFYAAAERVMSGPKTHDWETDRSQRPRPPGSDRGRRSPNPYV